MSEHPSAQIVIDQLGLMPHQEGGYFLETFRNDSSMPVNRPGGTRSVMTSIYYLLSKQRPIGYFHRNTSDIVHYWQGGGALRYTMLTPTGTCEQVILGPDVAAGEVLQLVVPGGYWKATELCRGVYGLLGEAVAPGFEYQDMAFGQRDELQLQYASYWDHISHLVK